jgi:hypothetical protein
LCCLGSCCGFRCLMDRRSAAFCCKCKKRICLFVFSVFGVCMCVATSPIPFITSLLDSYDSPKHQVCFWRYNTAQHIPFSPQLDSSIIICL